MGLWNYFEGLVKREAPMLSKLETRIVEVRLSPEKGECLVFW